MAGIKVESSNLKIKSFNNAELDAFLVKPLSAEERSRNAILLLHGFPSQDLQAKNVGSGMSDLAVRISERLVSTVLSIRFQGCGESSGNFSLRTWVEDVNYALQFMINDLGVGNIWVCGFGTGGSVGLVAASTASNIVGVVCVGSPADFDDWAANPDQLLEYSRNIGAIKDPGYPDDLKSWKAELSEVRAVESAELLRSKALLVMHGSEDDKVPHFDARLIADSHGDADLRFISGGGHQLRQDPRAIAVLIGWLDRQRVMVGASPKID